jgi:hypothetical protein
MTTDPHHRAPTTPGHDTDPANIPAATRGSDTAVTPNPAIPLTGTATRTVASGTVAMSDSATSRTAATSAPVADRMAVNRVAANGVAANGAVTHPPPLPEANIRPAPAIVAATTGLPGPGMDTNESATYAAGPTPAQPDLAGSTRTDPAFNRGSEPDPQSRAHGHISARTPAHASTRPAPAIRLWKDNPAMTATFARPSTPSPTAPTAVSGATPGAVSRAASSARRSSILSASLGAPGLPVSRPRLSRWRASGWAALARILVLLVVQVLMIAALMTGQADTASTSSALGARSNQVVRVAFTQPRASVENAAPSRSWAGSMSCAGQSRDGAGDAAGFNLNVVVGPDDPGFTGSGPGPLVVTCGQQGRLVILACAPLNGTGPGHDPAAWDRPPGGRAGWNSAGWDRPGWRGAWRSDWRDRGAGSGLSDEQLSLLNQLDPDQLRALLGQHDATTYPSGYPSGGGSGAGLGLPVGMRISVGTPIAFNQLPAPRTWGAPWNTTPSYGFSYVPSYGYGSSYADPNGPSYGYGSGPSYGPSSWTGPDDPDAPVLLSSHHHSDGQDSDHDSHDLDSDDDDSDSHHHDSGRDWNGRGVGVCRWIGQR